MFDSLRIRGISNKTLYPVSKTLFARAGILLFLLLVLPETVHLQRNDPFAIRDITLDIRKQFNLSVSELKTIKPLIDQESRNVVRVYSRFSGDQPEYSNRVWMQIVEGRQQFEFGIQGDLTSRQRHALRAVRSHLEARILDDLLQDYMHFLGDFLELGEFEYKDVDRLLQAECQRKRWLVSSYLTNPPRLQQELGAVTDETDRGLRAILSDVQWRYYLELVDPAKLVASAGSELSRAGV